jgi:hypothetical protein
VLITHYFSSWGTGLPPHVILYAYIKSLDVKIEDMPKKIEELLDRRQMAGPLSLDQIARAVENGSRITAMANGSWRHGTKLNFVFRLRTLHNHNLTYYVRAKLVILTNYM